MVEMTRRRSRPRSCTKLARTRLAQIWLVITINAMTPELLRPFTGLDLTVERDLDLYVDQLLVGVLIND